MLDKSVKIDPFHQACSNLSKQVESSSSASTWPVYPPSCDDGHSVFFTIGFTPGGTCPKPFRHQDMGFGIKLTL
ncbi:hypothetical protein A7Q10_05455 [Methylacidiphilum caldifontis]|uniref:Uncharacterized protein n=1 Tax=Methylacidiphilum caldifontis TaxID=2795386 RepID=A0A4Y8PIN0_9BACT|nr:hypothetical protein A7Q10_05455 [Methylacidiphilum caldifontis]